MIFDGTCCFFLLGGTKRKPAVHVEETYYINNKLCNDLK